MKINVSPHNVELSGVFFKLINIYIVNVLVVLIVLQLSL